MPRQTKLKRKNSKDKLNFHQLSALFVGWRDPKKYPHVPRQHLGFFTYEDARKSWDKHKKTLRVSKWLDVYGDWNPGWRPWAWWEFESPEKRNRKRKQEDQLRKMGVLTKEEEIELFRRKIISCEEKEFNWKPDVDLEPLPEEVPYTEDVQALIDKATKKVRRKSWFKYLRKKNGQILPADADAIINHGCFIDEEAGWHACDFIEAFCKSSESEGYLKLQDWQSVGFIFQVFGWMRPNGERRFREFYVHVAKKNGKSTLCSAIAIYAALADGQNHPRVYCTATTKDQAEIVHGESAAMVSASPELFATLKPIDSKKTIFLRGERGKKQKDLIIALASGAESNEGWKTYFLISDELHAWTNRPMYSTLVYGMKGRRNGMRGAISTAGESKETLGGEKYEYSKRIEAGLVFNSSFFALVFDVPEGIDIDKPEYYLNPEIWKMCNPALGLSVDWEQFRDDLFAAIQQGDEAWATFKRYQFNVWVGTMQRYLPAAAWGKCGRDRIIEEDYIGKICFPALDLSNVSDITALIHLFPWYNDEDDGNLWVDVIPRLWVPEAIVDPITDKGIAPYRQWVKDGYLTAIPGNFIDKKWVWKQIQDDAEKFDFEEVVYDRRYAHELMKDAREAGLKVAEFGQGFVSMSPPTKELLRMVLAGRVRHGNHPAMAWMASNATAERSETNDVKLVKYRKNRGREKKIDGIIALIMSLARVLHWASKARCPYEDEGITFI